MQQSEPQQVKFMAEISCYDPSKVVGENWLQKLHEKASLMGGSR